MFRIWKRLHRSKNDIILWWKTGRNSKDSCLIKFMTLVLYFASKSVKHILICSAFSEVCGLWFQSCMNVIATPTSILYSKRPYRKKFSSCILTSASLISELSYVSVTIIILDSFSVMAPCKSENFRNNEHQLVDIIFM